AERYELKGALQKELALKDQAGAAAAEGDEEAKRLQTALQELQTSNKALELEKEDLAEQLMRAKAECMKHEESSQTGTARASLLEEELQREKTKLEQLRRQMSEASESLAKAEAERDELQESSESTRRELEETKASRAKLCEALQRAEAELETSRDRLQPRDEPEAETERKRIAQLESDLLLLREQLHHLETERGVLQEELRKAEADLRQADAESPAPPGPSQRPLPATIGKDVEAPLERPWLQARLGELEAQNAALKRSLNQRPIVYQFAPPDAGIDSPDEQGEDDSLLEVEVVSTSQSFSALGQHFAQSLARRCFWFWQHCRKRRWMWGLEQQLRWLTRRILERPFLMWVFYLHVLVLWCLEVWHQALAKPLPADPAMALESAVQAARGG
ncbi:unnamed protein product, partial [Symbiodinium sp. KB8]